jgi:hypothetical protein
MSDLENIAEGKELTGEQIGAIIRVADIGRKLQSDLPEIANDYREGMFIHEIVAKYNIQINYSATESVAWSAVQRTLAGHDGFLDGKPYSGLIADRLELERLAEEHKRESGKMLHELGIGIHGMTGEEKRLLGLEAYRNGTGIHSMTTEERREIGKKTYEDGKGVHGRTKEEMIVHGRKAGKIGGKKSRDMSLGIHAETTEKKRERGKRLYKEGKGIHAQSIKDRRDLGSKSAISRGFVPWLKGEGFIPDEKYCTYWLSIQPKYQRIKNPNKGKPNWGLVQERVNELYHEGKQVRSIPALQRATYDVMKSIKV